MQRKFVYLGGMHLAPDYQPEYESLKELLVEMAREREVDVQLNLAVRRLARRPHVALAKVWLIKPGSGCNSCIHKPVCPDRRACLHLTACAVGQAVKRDCDSLMSDRFNRRIPVGVGPVGRVAASGRSVGINGIEQDPGWLAANDWARPCGFISLGGQPLVHKEEIYGVIAVYSLIPLERIKEGRFWLRMIANLSSLAIANARALEQIESLKLQLELENDYLRKEIDDVKAFGDIIGNSPPLLNVLQQVEVVAPTDATVVIQGESGTGKELIAREIHRRSKRKDKPLIKVNCSTIPENLFESEFFGHVKGAFTGAVSDRMGRFQAADGGTLFMDEVTEMPYQLQGKLLQVLQEGCYQRVGEDRTRHVDVRIIVATNKDLKEEVRKKRFRQDLFYRLNVFPIEIAPLRDRRQDIPLLAEYFLENVCRRLNRPLLRLSRTNVRQLQDYPWPGNVRELQNAIERAVITSSGGRLHFDLGADPFSAGPDLRPGGGNRNPVEAGEVLTEAQIKAMMRKNLELALAVCGGKIYGPGGAAALLGIRPTTLASRLKRMGIRK